MRTRFVPVLEFVLDEGVRNSLEVARLLAEEKARTPESEVESQTAEESAEVLEGEPNPTPSPDRPTEITHD